MSHRMTETLRRYADNICERSPQEVAEILRRGGDCIDVLFDSQNYLRDELQRIAVETEYTFPDALDGLGYTNNAPTPDAPVEESEE